MVTEVDGMGRRVVGTYRFGVTCKSTYLRLSGLKHLEPHDVTFSKQDGQQSTSMKFCFSCAVKVAWESIESDRRSMHIDFALIFP